MVDIWHPIYPTFFCLNSFNTARVMLLLWWLYCLFFATIFDEPRILDTVLVLIVNSLFGQINSLLDSIKSSNWFNNSFGCSPSTSLNFILLDCLASWRTTNISHAILTHVLSTILGLIFKTSACVEVVFSFHNGFLFVHLIIWKCRVSLLYHIFYFENAIELLINFIFKLAHRDIPAVTVFDRVECSLFFTFAKLPV